MTRNAPCLCVLLTVGLWLGCLRPGLAQLATPASPRTTVPEAVPEAVVKTAPPPALLTISPPRLTLDDGTTGVLTLLSTETNPLRFQLVGATWTTDETGQITWQPSSALVAYPALFTLNPGASQLVRVGVTATPGAVEQAYRLYFQELPDRSVTKNAVALVRWLGVPIWVSPRQPHQQGRLLPLVVQKNRLSIAFQNTGNVHFTVLKVTVHALGANKQSLGTQVLAGAYVLAGKQLNRAAVLPSTACAAVRLLQVEFTTAEQPSFLAQVDTLHGVCP